MHSTFHSFRPQAFACEHSLPRIYSGFGKLWPMRVRPYWSLIFFAIYLAIQIAVPTYRLFQPRPTRFGWQMFSASSLPTRVWLISAIGTREISPVSYIGNVRSDLDYERYALPQICTQSGTQSIRYLMPFETSPHEFKC